MNVQLGRAENVTGRVEGKLRVPKPKRDTERLVAFVTVAGQARGHEPGGDFGKDDLPVISDVIAVCMRDKRSFTLVPRI